MLKHLALLGCGNTGFDGTNPSGSFTYRAGPASTLVDSSSTSNASTWFANYTLPVASTLSKVEIRSLGSASVKLKLAVPRASGGWTVTDLQMLSVVAGTNTFTVAGATLTTQSIPANSMLGFFCSTASMLQFVSESPSVNGGYTAFTGDVSGTVTAVPSSQTWTHELQFAWEATASRSNLPSHIFSETFDGTTLPARFIQPTTVWTFAAGTTSPAATNNFLRRWTTTNCDRRTIEVDFSFTDSSTELALFSMPVISGSSTDNGAMVSAKISTNELVWYNPVTSTIPTVRSSHTITGFTLSTGVNYRLKITKDGKTLTGSITNLDTSATFSFSYDNDVSYVIGYLFGAFALTTVSGTGVTVTACRDYTTETNPRLAIYGDSIVEGSGTTDDLCFAKLLLDSVSGHGWYSGDGGTTCISIYRRWLFDCQFIVPKYVLFLAGANNANSDAEVTLFATDMPRFIDRIVSAGSVPLVCYITPNSDATKQGRINTMNAAITSKLASVPTAIAIRTDIALSVGGDGVTWNTSLMSDGVHPNTAGHAAMAARIRSDAPSVFN